MLQHHFIDWFSLPVEIRNHIEWVENWQDYPPCEAPTTADCLLAEELLDAWYGGLPLEDLVTLYQRKPVA